MTPQARHWLIGIGNRLRGDDGAGYRLAETLLADPESTATPLQVLAVQQLTPELAAAVSGADAVLFVDAWLENAGHRQVNRQQHPRLLLEPIETRSAVSHLAPSSGQRLSHQFRPSQLLELSGALYGQRPRAWQLLLPARQLGHGDALSPTTARALAAGLQLVRQWRPGDA